MLTTLLRLIPTNKLILRPKQQFSCSERYSCKKVAVVLSGCGAHDGTEIHEASAAAVHLSRIGVQPVFYSVSGPQADVVDHLMGCPANEGRMAIVEAARIARGRIQPLFQLRPCDVSAAVFPGGFGVAKTMSSYATEGANFTLCEEVQRVISEFCCNKKPMVFMCISALLAAKIIPNVTITLGMKGNPAQWPHAAAVDCACQMGATVELRPVTEYSFDIQKLVLSTPAFMYEGTFYEIFSGIGCTIDVLYKLI